MLTDKQTHKHTDVTENNNTLTARVVIIHQNQLSKSRLVFVIKTDKKLPTGNYDQ